MFYALLIIFTVFFLLVALLPTIVSLNPVRRLILKKAKNYIQGSITIRSWSFGWFTGANIEGITFDDRQGVSATAERIFMASGLTHLLWPTKDLGSVLVLKPELSILLQKPSERKKSVMPEKPPFFAKPIPVGVNIKGLFMVQDGRIMIRTNEGQQPLLIEQMNVNLEIEGLNNPLKLHFSATQGEKTGEIRTYASLQLIEEGELNIQNIKGNASINCEKFDLEPFSEVAGYLTEFPQMNGQLNCMISVLMEKLDHADVEGHIQLDSLVLTGGPLGNDSPSFDIVSLDVNLSRSGRTLEIKTFNFDAPFAKVSASGGLKDEGKKYPSGVMALKGRVDMARILSDLPQTLKIKEGLQMASGQIVFSTDIQSADDKMTLVCDVEASDIKAKQGMQTLTLDSPIHLAAKALVTEKGPRLEHLRLSSAFANASGKGDMDDLEIDLSVDLNKTSTELGKFVDLKNIHTSGTMNASARMNSETQKTKTCHLDIITKNLSLKGLTPRPVMQDMIQANITGLLNVSEAGKLQDIHDLVARFQSPVLLADIKIQSLTMASKDMSPLLQDLSANVSVELDKAIGLAKDIGLMTAGLNISGDLKLDCKADMAGGILDLSAVTTDITGLVLVVDGKTLSEPSVRLKGAANINPSTRQAIVRDLNIYSSAGQVVMPTAKVQDWMNLPSGLELKVAVNVTLDKLISLLSDFKSIPEGSHLSGSLKGDLSVSPGQTTQRAKLDLAIGDLEYTSKAKQVIKEKISKLNVDARINKTADELLLDSIEVETTPLYIKGSGILKDLKKTKSLEVKGTLTCDLARVGEIVTAFTGKPIDIEGKKPQDFTIQASLAEKNGLDLLRKMNASAGLYVKRLKSFGVEAHDLGTQLEVKDAQARVAIKSKVNEGNLNIMPVLDLKGKQPVLLVAENSKILDTVKIKDEMASELLGLIHPIFRECAFTGGRMGLLLKQCRVPIDETMKKEMAISGEVDLKEVVMTPSGLLKSIMDIIKLEPGPAKIQNQTISFQCRDGLIEPSPMTINVDGHSIILSGTMTYDGIVNYLAEVPVTEKMVSKEVYRYVKNTPLKLQIEGPVSKPRISKKSMEETLSSLVKEATKNLIKEKGGDLLKQLFKNK